MTEKRTKPTEFCIVCQSKINRRGSGTPNKDRRSAKSHTCSHVCSRVYLRIREFLRNRI